VARPYTLSIHDPKAGSGDRPCHVLFSNGTTALNEGHFQVGMGVYVLGVGVRDRGGYVCLCV
jgi:hypothetical protein